VCLPSAGLLLLLKPTVAFNMLETIVSAWALPPVSAIALAPAAAIEASLLAVDDVFRLALNLSFREIAPAMV
jgi:hypothetical protein